MSSGLIFLLTTVIRVDIQTHWLKEGLGVHGGFIFSLGQPSLNVLISRYIF